MSGRKQSLLAGGLISSAGIFISKFIGLLYLIPFESLLGNSVNATYYALAYNIYSYVLAIASAGLPFACATLVARYVSRNDYKATLLVKKLSLYLLTSFGVLCMLVLIISSPFLANIMYPSDGSPEMMRNVLIVISTSLFIVPILSAYRGYYQGLKEMNLYATSQVLEQIVRVTFLLTMSAIAIYVFNAGSVWALYFGVMSAAVAGVLTILYIKRFEKKKMKEILIKCEEQTVATVSDKRALFKELIFTSIPFLLISIFGCSDMFINQLFLKAGLEAHGLEAASIYTSAIFYRANKLIAIPMILAPGFSAAIIPYVTSAVESKKIKLVKKYIVECIESILYIGLPLCLGLFVFARPIISILFTSSPSYEAISVDVLQWFSLEALGATISPVFTSLVMSIGYRRKIIRNTAIFAAIKLICTYPMIALLGVPGTVLSSLVAYIIFAGMNIYVIQKNYPINWKCTLRKLLFIAIGLLGFIAMAYLLNCLGIKGYGQGRIIALGEFIILGVLSCATYFAITVFFQIPQSIFHISISGIFNRIKRKVMGK